MKHIAPQDTLLITYHDKDGDKIGQRVVRTSVAEAITLGDIAIRLDQNIKSFRVLDVLYNSEYK